MERRELSLSVQPVHGRWSRVDRLHPQPSDVFFHLLLYSFPFFLLSLLCVCVFSSSAVMTYDRWKINTRVCTFFFLLSNQKKYMACFVPILSTLPPPESILQAVCIILKVREILINLPRKTTETTKLSKRFLNQGLETCIGTHDQEKAACCCPPPSYYIYICFMKCGDDTSFLVP